MDQAKEAGPGCIPNVLACEKLLVLIPQSIVNFLEEFSTWPSRRDAEVSDFLK